MSGRAVDRACAWVYEGVWGALAEWLRVPRDPPTLPVRPGERLEQVHPAPGFLGYLKFWFWIVLLAFDGAILAAWISITMASPLAGALLVLPALAIAVLPDIVAYVAIHLRYDTTWYVMTPRSMRLRRGVWVINEVTITYENIQNVRVYSGPVQRWFGIADVVVETAGAGGGTAGLMNQGRIEGVADAELIRDRIMERVKASRTAGLGDEAEAEAGVGCGAGGWTREHVEALREIRDLVLPGRA